MRGKVMHMEARHYEKLENDFVRCTLCPHQCKLKPGSRGICKTRYNDNGKLNLLFTGILASSELDPIEKKPLYHFYPGSKIYSIGGYGCNLHCLFCQNHEISQCVPDSNEYYKAYLPNEIVAKASVLPQNIGIAYTYNEPTVFYELMLETSILAKKSGLKNVMVSNGYISQTPLQELLNTIDAFNIDLKAFSDEFYKTQTGGRLKPVLESLKSIVKHGNHLEIAFLVIPGLNDSLNDAKLMFKWISDNLGNDIPLHINRYYPAYRMSAPPTSPETLIELRELAMQWLRFVYIGNLHHPDAGSKTVCPSCSSTLIERVGYNTQLKLIDGSGFCKICGYGPVVKMA